DHELVARGRQVPGGPHHQRGLPGPGGRVHDDAPAGRGVQAGQDPRDRPVRAFAGGEGCGLPGVGKEGGHSQVSSASSSVGSYGCGGPPWVQGVSSSSGRADGMAVGLSVVNVSSSPVSARVPGGAGGLRLFAKPPFSWSTTVWLPSSSCRTSRIRAPWPGRAGDFTSVPTAGTVRASVRSVIVGRHTWEPGRSPGTKRSSSLAVTVPVNASPVSSYSAITSGSSYARSAS